MVPMTLRVGLVLVRRFAKFSQTGVRECASAGEGLFQLGWRPPWPVRNASYRRVAIPSKNHRRIAGGLGISRTV
jgi:hypothetical protein